MNAATMHFQSGELDDRLHDMAMDDVAELVPTGEEDRLPERIRGEVTARHEAKEHGTRYNQKYELTPEREAAIRARYDGKTSTIRAIAEDIGVPWYTVRDWAQGRLNLRNPADLQPHGPGNLAKPATRERPTTKARGKIPWATSPTEQEQSDIEEARAKRAALVANTSADDVIPADTASGWLTPKWSDYADAIGTLISEQWDGTEDGLARLAERERIPAGVLRGWIDEHHLAPKTPKQPEPAKTPAKPASLKADSFAAWLDDTSGQLSAFVLHGVRDAVVLRGADGYRLLTPKGDWPNEPISRALIERIVRLLSGGASDASVYGVVYRAEGAGV